MAKIPSAAELGRTDTAGLAPRRIKAPPASSSGVGAGLELMGKALGTVSDVFAEREEKLEKAEAASFMADTRVGLESDFAIEFNNRLSSAPEDGKGFVGGMLEWYDQRAGERVALAPSERAGEVATDFAARFRDTVEAKATIFEHGRRGAHLARGIDRQLDGLETQAFRDPDRWQGFMAGGRGIINSNVATEVISAEKSAEMTAGFEFSMAVSAVRGLIDRDPVEAETRLRGAEFDDALGADGLARMLGAAEAAVARDGRERDATVRADVGDAVVALSRGDVPPDLEVTIAAAAGTKLETPLRGAVEDQEAVASFVRKPMREQAAALAGIGQKPRASRRDGDLTRRLRNAHAGIRKAVADGNGIALAAELGIINDLAPIDPSDPATLRARVGPALAASQHFGLPVSPFTDAETDGIAASLETLPADQATIMLNGLRQGLGHDAAIEFAGQVAPKRPELAMAIALVGDAPVLSREIIAGGRLLRDTPDARPSKADRVDVVEDVVGNLFRPETVGSSLRPFLAAAEAVYTARRLGGGEGDLTFDADTFEAALRDVMGGPIAYNGRTILPPTPGMDEDRFEDLVESLTQADLIEFGTGAPQFARGDPFKADMFPSKFFGAEAELITSGPGKYLVFWPGLGFIENEAGGVYELDLRAFQDR